MAIVQQLNCVPVASAKSSGLSGLLPVTYSCAGEGLPIPSPKGMGCGCAGLGCMCGMGGLTMDGTGLLGTGLFASGLNVSQWGFGELAVLALSGWMLYSTLVTTKRTAKKAHSKVKATGHKVSKSAKHVTHTASAFSAGMIVALVAAAGIGFYLYTQSQNSMAVAAVQ
jgi:hypothetical protein